MDIQELLRADFNQHVAFRERRSGIIQVLAPLYHEDGDMVDMFLALPRNPQDPIRISDHGMTLMRLSYSYAIDTATKQKILSRILAENGISEAKGRLFIDATPRTLYTALLQFAQAVAKVSNMQMFKREVIRSLFYETLNEFIRSALIGFRPEECYNPIASRDDLDVDWRFPLETRDIFLFGVKDTSKARLVGLQCLEYQKQKVNFRSVIVHESLEESLSKKDVTRITNIADKQFATLSAFLEGAEQFFEREAHKELVQ